jgi:NADH:ubiquinone oxidoreductase subunit H
MASMQRRLGPHTSGLGGVLQSFYYGLKLGVKEPILPELSMSGTYFKEPILRNLCYQN